MELKEAIELRHSVRSFTSQKPDWRKIVEAIDAANKAPLAGNIPSLRFVLISDRKKISQLATAAQQNFVANVHYVVVVCSDEKETKIAYDERAKMYCRQQAGAAIENFLLRLVDLGLASCWTGAFSDETVRNILQIPDDVLVEAILPVGYEYQKSRRRKKPDLDNVLYFETYKNRYMKPLKKPEAL